LNGAASFAGRTHAARDESVHIDRSPEGVSGADHTQEPTTSTRPRSCASPT